MKTKNYDAMRIKKHGIDLPDWIWNLCYAGKVKLGFTSRTSYIIYSLKEQAKRDGFLHIYEDIINTKTLDKAKEIAEQLSKEMDND